MMADLVDDDVRNQGLEADSRLGPFVEQRAAIEMDHRRQLARRPAVLLVERTAGIKTGELERVLDTELREHLVVGIFLDPKHDIGEMAAERLGQARDRRIRKT